MTGTAVSEAGVRVERAGSAAVLTLSRPDRANALDPVSARALTAALEAVGHDRSVAGVVLTGDGPFCAGGDMKAIVQVIDQGEHALRDTVYGAFQTLARALVAVPVPVIAAVDGPAIGFGFDLALGCDCRLVGSGGWFRQGWAAGGAIPATGGVLFLERVRPDLLWRLLDGQPAIDGPAAERLGLGEAIDGSGRDAAIRRVESYANIAPHTLRSMVELARANIRIQLESHLPEALEHQVRCFLAPEFRAFTDRFRD
jgi:enoyl-CoA hydratase/carnithine racemase